MRPRISLVSRILVTCLLASFAAVGAVAQTKKDEGLGNVVYRYKNAEGVTVMDSAIPPEYVSKGYEVLSRSGKVLKVVSPALVGDAAEKARQQRIQAEELARTDLHLRRSYSNVADIDAAKERNLQSLQGNIGILEANLISARGKLQTAQQRAASIERGGRAVPEDLLKSIRDLEQEEKDIESQIKQRQEELQVVADKFDADRKRFIEITTADKPRS